jgi:hypothetical protein
MWHTCDVVFSPGLDAASGQEVFRRLRSLTQLGPGHRLVQSGRLGRCDRGVKCRQSSVNTHIFCILVSHSRFLNRILNRKEDSSISLRRTRQMYSADMYVTHFDHGLMWSYVRARDGEVTAGERAAISCAWLELSVGGCWRLTLGRPD